MTRLLPTLLLLGACGGRAQLVTGQVDRAGFGSSPREIRALRGSAIAAAAALESDGSFLLALAPGTPATFELRSSAGRVAMLGDPRSGAALELEVCEPGEPLDLGGITFSQSACLPTEDCRRARHEVEECRRPHPGDPRCDLPPGCAGACLEELEDLGRCAASGAACDEERTRLQQCLDAEGCSSPCCDDAREREMRDCAVCAGDSPAAIPASPPRADRECSR